MAGYGSWCYAKYLAKTRANGGDPCVLVYLRLGIYISLIHHLSHFVLFLPSKLAILICNTQITPMNQLYSLLFIILFCGMFGCSEEGADDFSLVGTNISVSDISGSWNATQAIFSRTGPGPGAQVDVVAEGGSVTLQIQNDGRFTVTVTESGEAPEISTGRLGFDEDLLVISFDDDPEEFEFFGITHNEPNMTIQGGNGSAGFDFDGDGVEEAANIDFVLVRI